MERSSMHTTQASAQWSSEMLALAGQAKGLIGSKLEALVSQIQSRSGKSRESCWRLVIQRGLRSKADHRRWSTDEIDFVRERLVVDTVEDIAQKIGRTPKAVRSMLLRHHLSVREIRCDVFSVTSLSVVLHVRRARILEWISKRWLPAQRIETEVKVNYRITPEGLAHLYKHHLTDLLRSGLRNAYLLEAFVQYCYTPKRAFASGNLRLRGHVAGEPGRTPGESDGPYAPLSRQAASPTSPTDSARRALD